MPVEGVISPAIILRRVDLPHPDSPTILMNVDLLISIFISFRTTKGFESEPI
jgi:hypothetical protein